MLAPLIALAGALALCDLLYGYLRQRRALERVGWAGARAGRSSAPRTSWPSVTVVRPVRGLDVGAADNFAAALDTGYPGEVETLFVFDDASDPAYPLACEMVARHRASGRPGRAEVLVAGPPPPDLTGKLNAMLIGERAARGELVAFGDSDTRPDREVLGYLVEELLANPGAGSAFAPVVVSNPPRGIGDAGYALLINGLYGPAVAACAGEGGDVPFIMGQLMVFRREALAAIGGIACAHGQLVDDMYIGRRVASAGFRNVMGRHPLRIVTGGMDLASFSRLMRRWLMFSRNGLPRAFTSPQWMRGLCFAVAWFGTAVALGTGHVAAAILPAAALAAFGITLASLQRRFSGAPLGARNAWVIYALPFLAAGALWATAMDPQVDWRGRAYALDGQARLAGVPPA